MKTSDRPELSTAGSHRKKSKSQIEKKRRTRINNCLEELKSIVGHPRNDATTVSKLEKADILELTLHYLRKVNPEGQTANSRDSREYLEGYSDCANAILSFFKTNKLPDNQSNITTGIDALQTLILKQQAKAGAHCKNTNDGKTNASSAANTSRQLECVLADKFAISEGTVDAATDFRSTRTEPAQTGMQKQSDNIFSQEVKNSSLTKSEHCVHNDRKKRTLVGLGGDNKYRPLLVNNSVPQNGAIQSVYPVAVLLPCVSCKEDSLVPIYGFTVAEENDFTAHNACSEKEYLTIQQAQSATNRISHGFDKYSMQTMDCSDQECFSAKDTTECDGTPDRSDEYTNSVELDGTAHQVLHCLNGKSCQENATVSLNRCALFSSCCQRSIGGLSGGSLTGDLGSASLKPYAHTRNCSSMPSFYTKDAMNEMQSSVNSDTVIIKNTNVRKTIQPLVKSTAELKTDLDGVNNGNEAGRQINNISSTDQSCFTDCGRKVQDMKEILCDKPVLWRPW